MKINNQIVTLITYKDNLVAIINDRGLQYKIVTDTKGNRWELIGIKYVDAIGQVWDSKPYKD